MADHAITDRIPTLAGLDKTRSIVAIIVGVLTAIAILFAPVGLTYSMRGDMRTMSVEMKSIGDDVSGLVDDVKELREERWTPEDQLTWARDEFAPLETRVRDLETSP